MEIINNPIRTIGTLCPSSLWLAKAMTDLDEFNAPQFNILEIGGGTGAISKEIIKKMKPEQTLDIVEIIPAFSKILLAKFDHISFVNIHNQDIRAFDENKKYDLIFSGLPFNVFPPVILKHVIDKILYLSKPKAKMAFFEYKWSRVLTPLWMNKKDKEDFYISRKMMDDFIKLYSYDKISINLNIPPAYVYYLALNPKG